MAASDADDADADGGTVNKLHLEDGGLVLYDPDVREAWLECRSPVRLTTRR